MSAVEQPSRVVVIGGANVDVQGRLLAGAVRSDSNPGRVTRSPGGVGRNLAHGLATLGVDTTLVTAWGNDDDGRWLAARTEAAGVDLAHVVWSTLPTATYLAVIDEDGELVIAVNDMAVMAEIDVAVVDARSDVIDGAEIVVVDCNLGARTLAAVAERGRPLFVDPVSAVKAPRIGEMLDRVHTIKPNRAELAALTGLDVATTHDVEAAARSLLDRGVARVVVSLGARGVMAVEAGGIVRRPASPTTAAAGSVTGAGDALLAALVAAHLRGDPTADAVGSAVDAAAAAIESASAVADRPS